MLTCAEIMKLTSISKQFIELHNMISASFDLCLVYVYFKTCRETGWLSPTRHSKFIFFCFHLKFKLSVDIKLVSRQAQNHILKQIYLTLIRSFLVILIPTINGLAFPYPARYFLRILPGLTGDPNL